MRIVFVLASADLSGGVRTVARYAQLLGERGHRVTVVSAPRPVPPLRMRVKSWLRGRGWRGARPGPSHLDGVDVEFRMVDRFRPIVDADVPDADVVIATWWLTAEWVAGLSPRKGAKVQFVQGNDVELPHLPEERVVATWRLPLRRIVCSRWLAELARDRYHDAEARLVPNGVDTEHFTAPPRGRQPRPTVGFVYGDAPIKGFDIAVSGFSQAARALPDLQLLVFGAVPPAPAHVLPPGTEYLVRPSQDAIPGLYARCDAWMWPSRREGFGLPILEAMACRTPVIAAPAGAAPEILAQGGGVLLPAADAHAMADGILRVCRLPDREWRVLSEEARRVALGHRWDESVRQFEAALEAALGAAMGRSPVHRGRAAAAPLPDPSEGR